MTLIKEMKYKPKFTKADLLAKGAYKDYEYFVVSYGVHPCAYIALREGQPYHNARDYEDVHISCHGGCTFVEKGYNNGDIEIEDKYTVIGWDYGHYDDFSGTYFNDSDSLSVFNETKRWTTKELIKECEYVIEQLYVLEHPELSYR